MAHQHPSETIVTTVTADSGVDNTRPQTCLPMCPHCLGSVSRVQRWAMDRLLSRFVPVRRYRCTVVLCGWEGLMRDARFNLASGDNIRHYHHRIGVP